MIYEEISNLEVKKQKRNTIYQLIYKKEKLSKQDIAYFSDLSLPTVTQNLNILIQLGLIEQSGMFASTGGRKARMFSCIKTARFAVGLDITKNHISIVLVDLFGNIISNIRISKIFENNHNYYRNLGALLQEFITNCNVEENRILGVGIALPGIISEDNQTTISSYVLGFGVGKIDDFTEFIPYRCMLCNDANAAGIAEMWNNKTIKNAVYLSLSNSVGGSIILNNTLYKGENQRGGEIGHMTILPNGKKCYCGKKGCLDSYCSAAILSNAAFGNLEDFFSLLKQSDPEKQKIWNNYLNYLAIAINNLRMLFDCNIIIGGYVGCYIDDYIEDLKKLVSEKNTFENNASFIKSCKYKLESSAVGAALQFIQPFVGDI